MLVRAVSRAAVTSSLATVVVVVVVVVVDVVLGVQLELALPLMGAHMHSVWFWKLITSMPFFCPLGVSSMVQK